MLMGIRGIRCNAHERRLYWDGHVVYLDEWYKEVLIIRLETVEERVTGKH